MAKKPRLTLLQQLQTNPWYAIIFLTAVAAIFRIFFSDLIEFKGDEAQAVFVVANFLSHPYFIQVAGVSSIGVNYFPLQYYMLAILGMLTTDPIGFSWIIALVNTLLIPIFYLIVKKYYGQFVGLTAALVLATSPWNILYSRKIWNPDLILVLLIPTIYFLHRLITDHHKKAVLPLFILLILLVQLQFSGLFLLVVTFFILWFTKTKIKFSKITTGFAVGLIPAIPYIFYQLTSNPICKDCVAFFSYQGMTKSFDFNNFIRPFEIITGSYFDNPLGNDYSNFLHQFPVVNIFNLIFLGEMFIPLIGIYFVLKTHQHLLLAIYVIFVPLLYFITATPALMYYFIILSPFIAILYGLGIKYFVSITYHVSPVIRYTLYSILFIPFFANLIFMYSFFSFIGNKKVIDGDFGPIFPVTKNYVENTLADYQSYPDYNDLINYSYMFANPQIIHSKLGQYFAEKQQPNLAMAEFKKAIDTNPEDISSLANLTYILIITGNIPSANFYLDQLKTKDPANAAKLEQVLEQVNMQRQNATQSGILK